MEIKAMSLSQEGLKSKAVLFCEDFGGIDMVFHGLQNSDVSLEGLRLVFLAWGILRICLLTDKLHSTVWLED